MNKIRELRFPESSQRLGEINLPGDVIESVLGRMGMSC